MLFIGLTPLARSLIRSQSGEGAIDFLRLHDYYPSGDNWIDFRVNAFETFSANGYSDRIETRAAFLGREMAKDLPLLAGTRNGLKPEDILITKKVADALLEKSPYGYISEYRDLIGMISNTLQTKDGKNPRIAGIVDSDEIAVYFDETVLAKYTFDSLRVHSANFYLASDFGLDVKKGEVIYTLVNAPVNTGALTVGQKVTLGGADFTVSEVLRSYRIYAEYLEGNGLKKLLQEPELFEQTHTLGIIIAVRQPLINRQAEIKRLAHFNRAILISLGFPVNS